MLAWGTVPGLTVGAGDELSVHLTVDGTTDTTVNASIWRSGDPEPATFQLSATEATPTELQAPGHVGVLLYVVSSYTGPAPVLSVDALDARPLTP